MSHFTRVQTDLRSLDSLGEALTDLDIEFERAEAGVRVRGWRGNEESMAMSIRTGTGYDIGVRQAADGSLDLVADWWALETEKGITQESFMDRIRQRYAYRQVRSSLEAQGYGTAEEVQDEDGSIRLLVRRW